MWTVDGANNNDVGSNGTISSSRPWTPIVRVSKVHRTATARVRRSRGRAGEHLTRGGHQRVPRGAYYFGRNEKLASSTTFLKQAGQPKGPLSVHDSVWTFGGPIIKTSCHFFAAQEWNREQRGPSPGHVRTDAAERAGDFSGPLIADCSRTGRSIR